MNVILIVDDDVTIGNMLEEALKDEGFYYSDDQVITWDEYDKLMGCSEYEDPEAY